MKYSILICLTQSIPIAKINGKEEKKSDIFRDKSTKECENLVIEFKLLSVVPAALSNLTQ